MNKSVHETLAEDLSKIGFAAGGSGGSIGARWAARLLPTMTFSASVHIQSDSGDVFRTVLKILSETGQVSELPSTMPEVKRGEACLGSGFGNMNPTIIRFQVSPAGGASPNGQIAAERFEGSPTLASSASPGMGGTELAVAGAAKEGLIKQRSAEKAVTRLIQAVLMRYGRSSQSC